MKKLLSKIGAMALVVSTASWSMAADYSSPNNPAQSTQQQQQAPAGATGSGTGSDAGMGMQSSASDTGTIKAINKQSSGDYKIQLEGNAGAQKEFTVPSGVEVRDKANNKVSIKQVKKGNSVTLNLQDGQVTQIFVNS